MQKWRKLAYLVTRDYEVVKRCTFLLFIMTSDKYAPVLSFKKKKLEEELASNRGEQQGNSRVEI